MKEKIPLEVGVEGQEEYSLDEGPNLSEFDRVARMARRVTQEFEKENVILHDKERPNVVHDFEGSDMENGKGQKFLWTNLMVLAMPKWRSQVGMIYGPTLVHSRRT